MCYFLSNVRESESAPVTHSGASEKGETSTQQAKLAHTVSLTAGIFMSYTAFVVLQALKVPFCLWPRPY